MKLAHPFDPRTNVGVEQALWHNDPHLEALVRDIIERVKPARFVETGTHMGWTSAWVAHNYPDLPVFTVEVDADFYQRSGENLAPYPNVTRAHDSSVNFLWKLLPTLKQGVTLFFLDAHWNPPVPLQEECSIVSALHRFVCLIDDFNCWNPRFGGDTFYSRFSLDYTKSGPDGGGDAYLNDLSYVMWALYGQDDHHYRPNYEPKPGNNGVGLFFEGVEYEPPATWRRETWEEFLASRDTTYPIHPSAVW